MATYSMKRIFATATLGLTVAGAALSAAFADDPQVFSITLKDHRFTPSEIHVASGKPFVVIVTNDNDASDEFEMLFPAVERVLQPGDQGKVRIRPLGPGRFPFFGESDPDGEHGTIISE